MPDKTALVFWAAVLGLILGSFATALSYRVPRGESIAKGRSRCPACGRTLGISDLVPVLSWLANRGACRQCGARVPWRYPAIELAVCALAVSAALPLGWSLHMALALAMAPVLVTLAVIDLEHRILPDALIGVLAAAALAWRWTGDGQILTGLATAAVAFAGAVALDLGYRALTGSRGLGMGDAKLLAAAGLALDPASFLAFLFMAGGGGVAMGLAWRLKRGPGAFPFGPMILAAFWIALTQPVPTRRVLALLVAAGT